MASRKRLSSAPSGSSSSSTLGRRTSARASATRCRWPPDSSSARRSPKPSSLIIASASSTRRVEFGACQPLLAQAIGDIVEHVEMRKNRVGLEHHVRRPQVRRRVGHRRAVDNRFRPRWETRSRRSSAATWSCRSPTAPAARRTRRAGSRCCASSTATTAPKRLVTPIDVKEILLAHAPTIVCLRPSRPRLRIHSAITTRTADATRINAPSASTDGSL